MPLFLSNQLREEKKIISELKRKIQKSKTMEYDENDPLLCNYTLDDLILGFHVNPGDALLVVSSKSGKEIVSIEHQEWFRNDTKPRYKWIKQLYKLAKDRYVELHKDEIKRQRLAEATKNIEIADKAKEKQLAVTKRALERIRKL